ncbi:Mut7-C RNAse domain-containing protein [Halorarum salinum]|uniref:Mut7-C RNAse domain-containing protein n=1 Tax=Halorarum salinum TaxID=2743089 RepID=A0A7D5Q838_9EURY|nr:Mut7-C RNAse domain-containing protein [Halobaculum salinum]QLG60556.1 Mut7-C RNAse domain-containing protein [Halobaculum salinum]
MTPDGADGSGNGDAGPDGTDERDRLLLDAMLGTLATYLRMCGYDAAYALDRGIEDDDRLRGLAAAEGRRLLTRDASLADRTDGALLLESREVTDQLRELRAAGLDLSLPDRPTRCGTCNGPLAWLDDSEPRPSNAPADGPTWRCRDCGQHFWKGSHWDDVRDTLARL